MCKAVDSNFCGVVCALYPTWSSRSSPVSASVVLPRSLPCTYRNVSFEMCACNLEWSLDILHSIWLGSKVDTYHISFGFWHMPCTIDHRSFRVVCLRIRLVLDCVRILHVLSKWSSCLFVLRLRHNSCIFYCRLFPVVSLRSHLSLNYGRILFFGNIWGYVWFLRYLVWFLWVFVCFLRHKLSTIDVYPCRFASMRIPLALNCVRILHCRNKRV